jgi:hypothetical protein
MLGCGMSNDVTVRRRWLGASALVAALALLVGGETLFKGRLGGVAFVVYWSTCFALTGLAMVLAFRDLRALQQQTRDEQRDLLQGALKQIELEARARRQAGRRK